MKASSPQSHLLFTQSQTEHPVQLLTLSAGNETALRERAKQVAAQLVSLPPESFSRHGFPTNTSGPHQPVRLSVVAETIEQMCESLNAYAEGQKRANLVSGQAHSIGQPKIGFLFTGQGAQYPGMGRELYDSSPIFHEALQRCADLLDPYLEQPLLSVLYPASEDTPMLNETAYTQPALFALEYALAELWRSWGILPDAVLGHSVGEYVAACVAGAFSLEDGLKLIAERGRLMQELPHDGSMAVVFASVARLTEELLPYTDTVSIAAINGPMNTVLSGSRETMQKLLAKLKAQGMLIQVLTVSHAFHSPLMEPILDRFEQAAKQIHFHALTLPLISNLTGEVLEPGAILDAGYWRRHIREPVQFARGIQLLADRGNTCFLEIGPRPTLLGMGRKCLPKGLYSWLPSLKNGQNDWYTILQSVGTLYVHGSGSVPPAGSATT